jgi:hypothetical protein
MPCEPIKLPGGSVGTICFRGPRRRCSTCGKLGADRLCDVWTGAYDRQGKPKTCNRPVCSNCAVAIDSETDVCGAHPIPDEALAKGKVNR